MHEHLKRGHEDLAARHEHMPVQKIVVILGHPLTATPLAWLIELKGQRSARGGPEYPLLFAVLGGSPIV
jgi:hypothetical protein